MTLLELSFQRRKAKTEASGLLDTAMAESRTLTQLPSKSASTRWPPAFTN